MSNVQIFNNEQFGEVRTINEDSQVWFVAKDVCDSLEISNSRMATNRLDDDEKGVSLIDTLGGEQEVAIINEFGLYNLVLGSRKEEAKQFKRWITHEVIPSIRKTGQYSVDNKQPDKLSQESAVKLLEILGEDMDNLDIDNHSKLATKKYILEQSGMKLPLQIPAPTTKKFISMEEIARRVGIYSKSGNPHSQAVGAILEDMNIDEDRKTVTSGSNNSHTFSQAQYCETVIQDVKGYLDQLGLPCRIECDSRNKGYNVQYGGDE